MLFISVLAFINILFGFVFAYKSKKVTYLEFFILSGSIWIILLGIYGIQWYVHTRDIKFYNDKIIKLRYEEPWVSWHTCCKAYKTRCSGSGKHRHCTTSCAVWGKCYTDEGDYSEIYLEKNGIRRVSNKEREILQNKYFKEPYKVKGNRPSYESGSKLDVFWEIKKDKVAPFTSTVAYKNYVAASENIIKGSESVGEKVKEHPVETYSGLLDYNKVIGIDIDPEKVAILNSSLKTTANVIIYGFNGGTLSQCENLKAHWVNGKVNDLVFCLIYNNDTITFTNVFGWTESEIVKKELESLVIGTKVSEFTNKLDEIKKIIDTSYIEKDMEKYNYLSVKLTKVDYIVLVVFWLIFCIGGWIYTYENEFHDKIFFEGKEWKWNSDKKRYEQKIEGLGILCIEPSFGEAYVYLNINPDLDYDYINKRFCMSKFDILYELEWIYSTHKMNFDKNKPNEKILEKIMEIIECGN